MHAVHCRGLVLQRQIMLHWSQLDDLRNTHSDLFQHPGRTLSDLFAGTFPHRLLCMHAALLRHHSEEVSDQTESSLLILFPGD